MRTRNRRIAAGVTVAAAATLVVGAAVQAASPSFTPVPNAQSRVTGIAVPNALPPELADVIVAQGSNVLENPDGAITNYGYYNDGPFVPAPGGLTEATKSEPDKNTYLVMRGLTGADPDYDYGTHFLFQAHEGGQNRLRHPRQPRRRLRAPRDPARRRPARRSRMDRRGIRSRTTSW